jgi:hypothetical protein
MNHRIAVIAALLAALGAVFGVSATAAHAAATLPQPATTHYTIHNVDLGCIADPGHGNVVYVRFTCNTTFTFTNPVTTGGYTWYLLRINGGADCLNFDPGTGFVYADRCIPNDANEMWEHHYANLLGNLASGNAVLATCNDTGNSRLVVIFPTGCNFSSADQYTWEIRAS